MAACPCPRNARVVFAPNHGRIAPRPSLPFRSHCPQHTSQLFGRETGKGDARQAFLVLAFRTEHEDLQRVAVEPPDFGYAEFGINRQLVSSAPAKIDLDGQMGRRVNGEVGFATCSDCRANPSSPPSIATHAAGAVDEGIGCLVPQPSGQTFLRRMIAEEESFISSGGSPSWLRRLAHDSQHVVVGDRGLRLRLGCTLRHRAPDGPGSNQWPLGHRAGIARIPLFESVHRMMHNIRRRRDKQRSRAMLFRR